jgi:hypothetical protein
MAPVGTTSLTLNPYLQTAYGAHCRVGRLHLHSRTKQVNPSAAAVRLPKWTVEQNKR